MSLPIRLTAVILAGTLILAAMSSLGLAAPDGAVSGGYLAGYENIDPRPATVSGWSTLAYLISLLAIFVFVLAGAYFVSRFVGTRFTQGLGGSSGRILEHLPLGPNRSVCTVEMADHVFMLGVTEHSISVLCEITDHEEIERLRRHSLSQPLNEDIFSKQAGYLEQLVRRIQSPFNKNNS